MDARNMLMGIALGLSSLAHAQEDPGPHISVTVGKPTFVHQLRYEVMYSEKPFELATIYYYDNGLYKIVSPGENHYGVYLVMGKMTDPSYAISYLSLPSDDWGGNVARHDLKFDSQRQVFEQQALSHEDQSIPPQRGTFVRATHDHDDPAAIVWQQP
ncbi:hypothetical protein [Pseudomonas sp. REB1044]|uniref:hypothetical protein n=1 Tax=Pseudomonas sp. REB1044 TaxID=2675224 RepID=UPI00315DE0B7